MKTIISFLLCLILCQPAYATKDYCKKFPTDTPVECYTPNNPPPGGGVSSVTAGDGSIQADPTTGDVVLTGAGYWVPTLLTPASLYPSDGSNRVTVGNNNTSYDTFTVNSAVSGATINGLSINPALTFKYNGSDLGNITFNGSTNEATITNNGNLVQTFKSTGNTFFWGDITTSGHNFVTDTGTGTDFATATNQKIGFYGVTPRVQPSGNVCTALQNLGLVTSCTESGVTSSSLTINTLPKATGASAIGDSSLSDDGTTLTYSNSSGIFALNNTPTGIGGIDTYTKVMLHLNNNITDSAWVPNTFTNVGSVAFTNTSPPFTGTYWAIFNGGGTKALTTPANSAFDMGSSNWTVDLILKWNTHTTTGIFLSDETDSNNYVAWFWSTGSGLNFQLVASGSVAQRFHAAFTPVNGTQYHIAFVRNGASALVFVNGVSQSVTIDNAFGTAPHYTSTLRVGWNSDVGTDPDANIAELRFSPGIARWTAGFTPPATPYTSTAGTPTINLQSSGSTISQIMSNQATGVLSIANNGVTSQTIDSTGSTTFGNDINTSTHNIVTDTSTGTKLGTSASQKLGFFNATPIVQPSGNICTALQNLGIITSCTVTATTNANLTGPITSVGNATSIASQTGTGTKFVVDTSPTLVTPALGSATYTTLSGGNVTLIGTGGVNNTIDFGANFGVSALYLYNNGVANRWGWGLNAGEMQFFGASATGNHFSWNKGGDFQASGTNELMRLSQTAAGKGALGPNNLSPQTYLDVGGTAASASLGVEDQFYITRSVSGGVSFPEMFGISVGRYVAPTSFSPNSRADFKLKNDSTSTLVPDITIMTMQSNGYVGIGTTSLSAFLHVVGTTEQFRAGYDASNYYSTTVGSTGGVTFDAVGSGSAFTFSDPVTVPILNSTATQSTVNCATSGSIVASQPLQGSSYKEVIIYANACLGAAVYTYPTAFSHTPEILSQSLAGISSCTTTACTITGTTSTGFITVNGY